MPVNNVTHIAVDISETLGVWQTNAAGVSYCIAEDNGIVVQWHTFSSMSK